MSSLPLIVRPMRESETNLVLSAWKRQLFDTRGLTRWGRDLPTECFWALVNHTIDKITMPRAVVWVGCYEMEVATPLCWAVATENYAQGAHDLVYIDARTEILRDRPLAASLERELLSSLAKVLPSAIERRSYNPFMELKR